MRAPRMRGGRGGGRSGMLAPGRGRAPRLKGLLCARPSSCMAYRMRRCTGFRPSRTSGSARPTITLMAYWAAGRGAGAGAGEGSRIRRVRVGRWGGCRSGDGRGKRTRAALAVWWSPHTACLPAAPRTDRYERSASWRSSVSMMRLGSASTTAPLLPAAAAALVACRGALPSALLLLLLLPLAALLLLLLLRELPSACQRKGRLPDTAAAMGSACAKDGQTRHGAELQSSGSRRQVVAAAAAGHAPTRQAACMCASETPRSRPACEQPRERTREALCGPSLAARRKAAAGRMLAGLSDAASIGRCRSGLRAWAWRSRSSSVGHSPVARCCCSPALLWMGNARVAIVENNAERRWGTQAEWAQHTRRRSQPRASRCDSGPASVSPHRFAAEARVKWSLFTGSTAHRC